MLYVTQKTQGKKTKEEKDGFVQELLDEPSEPCPWLEEDRFAAYETMRRPPVRTARKDVTRRGIEREIRRRRKYD